MATFCASAIASPIAFHTGANRRERCAADTQRTLRALAAAEARERTRRVIVRQLYAVCFGCAVQVEAPVGRYPSSWPRSRRQRSRNPVSSYGHELNYEQQGAARGGAPAPVRNAA
jgi:hypothetical protein